MRFKPLLTVLLLAATPLTAAAQDGAPVDESNFVVAETDRYFAEHSAEHPASTPSGIPASPRGRTTSS